jgi:hypothetical protein
MDIPHTRTVETINNLRMMTGKAGNDEQPCEVDGSYRLRWRGGAA